MDAVDVGLVNIAVFAAFTAAPFVITGIIFYAKTQARIESIGKALVDIASKVEGADRELYPAIKNGGIVTSAELRETVELLEKTSERRHNHTKEMIKNEIDHIKEFLERFENKNKIDHTFNKRDIEDVVQRILINSQK